MPGSKFVYVTYIRTTPERLWQALIDPKFTRQYWAGTHQVSDWKVGADWKIMIPDGRVGDSGKVLEFDPPRRLKVSWRNEFKPELKAEGHSFCTYDLEPAGSAVKLTVTHEHPAENSKTIEAVSGGWPHLLASLKSLLETGESLLESRSWPEGV
ncbi:MAG TPA: SRPBCC family protein [Hyphomonadaceae bacterium]|nr:SRPBCC family protein [Hyphomonadaceae bacterium]